MSAFKDFVISRTRELCVSKSNTEEKRHPPSLKLLLNGEASARDRHFVTRIYPSEPIGREKKGGASNAHIQLLRKRVAASAARTSS